MKLFELLDNTTHESVSLLTESLNGQQMLEIFHSMHHDEPGLNPEMEQFILDHDWGIQMIDTDELPSQEQLFDIDDPFGRTVEVDPARVKWYMSKMQAGQHINPVIMGPRGSVIDGNHRVQAAKQLDKPIQGYVPMRTSKNSLNIG